MRGILATAFTVTFLAGCASQVTPVAPPARLERSDSGFRLSTPLPDLTSFALVQTNGGALPPVPVSVDQAAEVLKTYDVIFIGEVHRHPANHLAQMELFRALYARTPNLALSMEQFERDVQGTVDDFVANRIGEAPFREKSRAWDNYPGSYRPLVEFSKAHGLSVIAAEAPTMVVRCVGQEGAAFLDRMKPEQRGWAAAQLHLDVPGNAYKNKFMEFAMGNPSHNGGAESAEPSPVALRSYAAQVTRDDTMAESIYLHLQKNAGHKVVHLNGFFHSESFLGTAERLKLRDPRLKIAVVNPISTDPQHPAFTADEAKTGTFILLIGTEPPSYISDDEMKAAMGKQMDFRATNKCEL